MATLLLTAIGTAVGGSIGALGVVGGAVGGAIGALAGQAIDGVIFRPGARSGPRLSDLQVQSSRYGAQIPRLYGKMRVAGTVIWSTDLRETSATSGGGKGQPSVTRYSYSASFAVALSSRPIMGIGRIWADGNLLRGEAGDFKSPVGAFRLHAGQGGQAVDPLIAADVGIGVAPAFRGCAYALFEDLQLADFGNRIPSLTFEVIADDGVVGVGAILSDLAGRDVPYSGDEVAPVLRGFAAEGGDLRDASDALVAAHGLRWRERDGVVSLAAGSWSGRSFDVPDEIRLIDGEAAPAGSKRRAPIDAMPARLAIRHHDPARDYQIGIQAAERPGPGARVKEVDLPAVLSADEARQLADRRLREVWRGRTSLRRSFGWAGLDLAVGDIIALGGEPGRWLIEGADWDNMAVRLTLRAIETGARPLGGAGAPGEPVLQMDAVQGVTRLAIVELPPDGQVLASVPAVYVAATGDDAGWRRAALFRYRADLEVAEPIGPTAPRAVLGMAETVLPDAAPWLFDRRSSIEVLLDNDADALVGAADVQLLAGANLCQIGEEMLQYGDAQLIGPRRYRLSRLVRGRNGTEWAMGGHAADERFVFIDANSLVAPAMGQSDVGKTLIVRAVGSGDVVPAEESRLVDGRAMMPLSPVHGQTEELAGGDLAIAWVRRSRLGLGWTDGSDAPLGEEAEAYVLRAVADGIILREWEVGEPIATYPVAQRLADEALAAPAPVQIEIRQRGTWGLSKPLVLDLA